MVTVATKQINLRLDEDFLAQLDTARGLVPRNVWIVAAIKQALGQNVYDGLTETGPSVHPKFEPAMDTARPVRRHKPTCDCPVCKAK